MIEIPDDATPADVVGETDILPGQNWLNRSQLLLFANLMERHEFPWHDIQHKEPMEIQEGSNGRVITQGHHRWVAAQLAGVEIPVRIRIRRDFWPGLVPFARTWDKVNWEAEE